MRVDDEIVDGNNNDDDTTTTTSGSLWPARFHVQHNRGEFFHLHRRGHRLRLERDLRHGGVVGEAPVLCAITHDLGTAVVQSI